MPLPRWLAHVNKRVFNPRTIRRESYPIVEHVGRGSGRTYRTPLDAFPTTSGYVLVCRYGPESDWVQNVLTAGEANLRVDGEDVALDSPRLVPVEEALAALTSDTPSRDFTRAQHFVLMDRAS